MPNAHIAHEDHGHFRRKLTTLCFRNLFWCLKSLASPIHLCNVFNINHVQMAILHWEKKLSFEKLNSSRRGPENPRDFRDFIGLTHDNVLSLGEKII